MEIKILVDVKKEDLLLIESNYYLMKHEQEPYPMDFYSQRMYGDHMVTIQISLEHYRLLEKYKMLRR